MSGHLSDPHVVEVTRSGMVESRHRGRAVGLTADGTPAVTLGDVHEPVYGRSANKPLQAAAMARAGLDLPPELLALVAASHSGETMHLDGVRRILATAGLDETTLRNTPGLPLHEPSAQSVLRAGGEASTLLHNCSGKHAGMVATCVVNGWPLDGYLEFEHPLQAHITGVIAELAGEPVAHVGVDGCGAPAHAVSLGGLARAFRAITTAPAGSADRQVVEAMLIHPDLVGGTGRAVTLLMKLLPGLVAKDGAEGVLAAATTDGQALALKISDGANRGRVAFGLAVLDALGVDTSAAADRRTEPTLGGGQPVGEVRAVWPTPPAGPPHRRTN